MNPKRFTARHIIIKMSKVKKNNNIKNRKKKQFLHMETLTKLSANFSPQTLQATSEWHDIYKVLIVFQTSNI